jgi:negative regulator of flagellin synthesis FlgM
VVDSIGPKSVSLNDRQVAPVVRASAAPAIDAATRSDGGTAAQPQLTALARQMAASPPVDLERVARIRRAISDGTFPIYPAKIADRLIALKLDWNPNDAA